MALGTSWDEWPCTHACTAFFHIAAREVEKRVPSPLEIDVVEGKATIEVGYVRFLGTKRGVPPSEELAWAIGVKRKKGSGMAFYAMNITADNEDFLDHNEGLGFSVQRPPARFDVDLDRRSFHVEDAGGPICTLRHQPEGSIPLPLLPGTTEVWTGAAGALSRRLFKWRGVAALHFSAAVATTLHDHPFFLGVRVSRANPVPEKVLSSARIARAAQLFSEPVPYQDDGAGARV